MAESRLVFELPWPPSVNTYWRHVGYMTILGKPGRAYRDAVIAARRGHPVAPAGRLSVCLTFCPPNRRGFDLDNFPKGVLDALKHSGCYVDDGLIDQLDLRRGGIVDGGLVVVEITEMAAA